ncbi:hypothetical protein ALC57_12286 [Trachymyrmex cornetzi]|uniref:Uncharacterized protein n=1 Tax=Trachymyrmex cornetzi TaxID=471704 RepID=A0A151J102_9HYME|nr:hypothetical protein ALC57_12286 [Trachymyrmex cornetzi]
MHAHAREGELAGSAAADSLRGENSKSFAVTIFLTAPPAPSTIVKKRGRERESAKEKTTVSLSQMTCQIITLIIIEQIIYTTVTLGCHAMFHAWNKEGNVPSDRKRTDFQ